MILTQTQRDCLAAFLSYDRVGNDDRDEAAERLWRQTRTYAGPRIHCRVEAYCLLIREWVCDDI